MRDNTLPTGAWAFDADVAAVFDDMLDRSIPDYAGMRAVTTRTGLYLARRGSLIVDLGCSNGEALAPYAAAGHPCLGLDVSQPMLDLAQTRYADNPRVELRNHDLRLGVPSDVTDAGLVLSILTLMFTPLEQRPRLVRSIRRSLAPTGALLLVEKIIGSTPTADLLLTDLYYDTKRASGYTEEQIERKRLSLEGVLVPLAAAWNEDLLRSEFRVVEPVWRSLNFAAWIALP